jgi:hypothetical protein
MNRRGAFLVGLEAGFLVGLDTGFLVGLLDIGFSTRSIGFLVGVVSRAEFEVGLSAFRFTKPIFVRLLL